MNRVKQAESELSAVQRGITDQTPLSQASQQFNAAVVALEMSWLRLFADAGCLTDEQQVQAEAAVRDYTTALQQSLLDAGYYDGAVDGVYGPATVDAIEALQKAHGLPVTGTVDKATAAALQSDLAAKGGAIAQEAVASTAAVQQTLKIAGFWDGPVDGQWSPELTEGLEGPPDRARCEADGRRRRGDRRGAGEGDRRAAVGSLCHTLPNEHPRGPFDDEPVERTDVEPVVRVDGRCVRPRRTFTPYALAALPRPRPLRYQARSSAIWVQRAQMTTTSSAMRVRDQKG